MYLPFFLFLLTIPAYVYSMKNIVLDVNNTILIRGVIDENTATQLVYDINSRKNKKDLYVFLDTNGGSVDAGNKIVNEIQKYNISCIAQKAISMGFVILQSCNKRYITPGATLMQHQISYGVSNEKAKVESYVKYIKQIGKELTRMQAKKIGIKPRKFKELTYNDWWLFGENAILKNCADEFANVKCDPQLTNKTYTLEYGPYVFIFSKCPLVTSFIKKKINKQSGSPIIFI